MIPAIVSFAGPALTKDEAALFRAGDPAGYILFGRNIENPEQLRRLTDSLRDISGRDDLAILIDQEGGTIARLMPPHWPTFPDASLFDRLYSHAPLSALAAVEHNAKAMALTLTSLGISVNCMPLLDIRQSATHASIAERCFGADPMRVAAMGRAALKGLADGGVVGGVKHMPGQGRAASDSHFSLPRVDADQEALESDLAPFRALYDAPMGMTSHALYTAWDSDNPATQSPVVIADVIRGRIGFDGLLMSDGLDMEALTGSLAARASAALAAGCDVALHCSGLFTDTVSMFDRIGSTMNARSHDRLSRAMQMRAPFPDVTAFDECVARRDALLDYLTLA